MQNNDKLLKNFKDLKEKLKVTNRENTQIKTALTEKETELSRFRDMEKNLVRKVHEIKAENEELKHENEQLRAKVKYAKDYVKSKKEIEEELELVKESLTEHK